MSIVKIGPFTPYDCNIYAVTGEHPIVVDAGTGEYSDDVIREIRKILGRDPETIIVTHCHFDHIGGLRDLVTEFKCKTLAGWRDVPYVRTGDPFTTVSNLFGTKARPVHAHEVREGDVIDTGDHRFTVLETPGHTGGSICLYEESTGYLISGDTLFTDSYGRTDFNSGSISEMRESLVRLSNIDIRGLFPGHGNTTDTFDSEDMSGILRMAGV